MTTFPLTASIFTTIGRLAEALGMSKSGVFAHFGSREDLQLAVLREYAARFVDEVLRPAVGRERDADAGADRQHMAVDLDRFLEQGAGAAIRLQPFFGLDSER